MVNNYLNPLAIIGALYFVHFMLRPIMAGKFHPKHFAACFAEYLFFMLLTAVVLYAYAADYPTRYGDELYSLIYTGGAGYHVPSLALGAFLVTLAQLVHRFDYWKHWRLGLDQKQTRA